MLELKLQEHDPYVDQFVITESNCGWQTIFEILPCSSAWVMAYSNSFIVVSRFIGQFRHSTNQQFLSTFCVIEVRCFVPGVIRSNFFFWLISDGSFFPKRRLASPVMYRTLKRLLRLMNTKVYQLWETRQAGKRFKYWADAWSKSFFWAVSAAKSPKMRPLGSCGINICPRVNPYDRRWGLSC